MRLSRLRSLVLLLPAAAAGAQSAHAPAPPLPPSLIVFITVDQFRPDYLTLFEKQLSGGLGRLYRGGAAYLDGYQDHAITETAPGHASTLSGRFPRSTGIVSNSAGVFDPQAPLLGVQGDPASPFRFRGTTLTDWLRYKDPATRALSVSRKDRGAILPMGRARQQVYWYPPNANGVFTTSTYYADTLPSWVQRFNARHLAQQWAGRWWDLLLDASQYPEPDSVPTEAGGRDVVFPHPFPLDSAQAAGALANYPVMDALTLSFALEGLRQLGLGTGPQTDVLAVSLSSTDAIGHRFGPDSREIHDQVLRLDRALGAFLDTLFTLRDSSRITIALTADHSVAPLPGTRSRYPNQGAGWVNADSVLRTFFTSLRESGLDASAARFDEGILFLDPDVVAQGTLNADAITRTFMMEMLKVPGVLRVDRVRSLAARDTVTDYVARRWIHMLPPDLPAAAVVTLKPYWYWSTATYPTHGSPHDYDARVPVLFYGAGVRPGHYAERVRVVDIAPTLASIARVRPMERLDGRVLTSAVRR